ncbi:FAD-dependent oxidoreductase [Asticcacaulis sp. BYS171W]|uniref:FAD-dependent oxidoreductase n=1 Tax=Asticcacaulis aquaticus TaxID=2984212 RepID=A0ABT5HTR1_9CAUL|nr:FAD-dependent oxidoreductase [Asticcacaulis aquaticus]MDC7683445.1 FAD-dependent oxidoreductase [Asticcacaulis aquaticus]
MRTIVIGGGIVGLSIALRLQGRGYQVRLIDRDAVRTTASYGNAGHIAIEQVEPLASMDMVRSAPRRWFMRGGALSLPPGGIGAWLPFSLRLLRAARQARFERGKAALSGLIAGAMPAWARLVADIARPDLLRQDGHYIVWESGASAADGLKSWRTADTGTAHWREVTPEERAALSSLTTVPIHGAIRFENTGQVTDTARLLREMEATFVARGGEVLTTEVTGLVRTDGQAAVRLEAGEVLEADHIVVAAGVWSKALLEPLGHKVPIVAERGYHIQSRDHGWPEGHPPVVFEDRSMIVTGFDSGLRAASFVELNRIDAPADPRKWQALRRHALELNLPLRGELVEWVGIRPTLPDYLPAIGRSDRADNLYYAIGHQHLGLTLGATTGEIVADMLASGVGPDVFDLKRFG